VALGTGAADGCAVAIAGGCDTVRVTLGGRGVEVGFSPEIHWQPHNAINNKTNIRVGFMV